MKKQTPKIAILPSPGISHLIPFVELSKRLILHDFHITCIIPCTPYDHPPSDATKSVLESLPKTHADAVFLPPVTLDDLPSDAVPLSMVTLTMSRSLPSIRDVLKSLSPNLVALFVDFFAIDALDIAKELDISTYVFCSSNAMTLSFLFYLPKLDEIAAPYDSLVDLPEPVKLPGCPPLNGRDLVVSLQDRRSFGYKRVVNASKRLVSGEGLKGFVVNTFVDIESEVIKAIREENKFNIYPVGPIVQIGSSIGPNDDGSECLTWLDNQPRGSVLYVSFGSGGTLSYDQTVELAFGLEMSGHRFIWVVRTPNNALPNAAYLDRRSQDPSEPLRFLPSGFLERIQGRGLVIPFWGPQTKILDHGSTGGFLSHCGWSSTLESIVSGVPLIAWPLHAEQRMNAILLVEWLKVALRPKANEDGLIRREEIVNVVKALMEGTNEQGKIVRDNMKNLNNSASKAVDKNGSSTKTLSELASTLKSMGDI